MAAATLAGSPRDDPHDEARAVMGARDRQSRGAPLAVLGSYVFGFHLNVPRLPYNGESLLGSHLQPEHGGKGSNQAVAAARLGARVRMAAAVGRDVLGDYACTLWEQEGVEVPVLARGTRPTGGFCVMITPDGKTYTVVDAGANEELSAADVERFAPTIAESPLLLAQLELSFEAIEAGFAIARRHGARTVLTPGPYRPLPRSLLALTDVIVPNEVEAKHIAGIAADAPLAPEALAEELAALGPQTVIVTRGAEGCFARTPDERFSLPAFAVEAVDPTGAGDSFLAGVAVALAEGRPLREAVRRGCASGALAVQAFGVIAGLPRRAQVEAFLAERGGAGA